MKFPVLLPLVALGSTAALAQNVEKLPDLQVVSVQTVPESPVAGDKVRLRVVVKNAGDAPTSGGTVIGGEFRLNKTPIAFTDTNSNSLAPGETVVLNASGGGNAGDGTWTAREGRFTLGFLVDDVNRIRESDENNNDFTNTAPLEVNPFLGPDLMVSRLTRNGSTLRALIQNTGKGATPATTPVEVRFSFDGQTIGSAQLNAPLAAGQSVEVVATSSESANNEEGTRVLTATVDADGRVAALERRRDNNALSRTFAFNQWMQLSPTSSDAFVDSIGVNAHLGAFTVSDGSFATIKARLLESRIRWIRQSFVPLDTVAIDRLLDLGKSGIKTNLLLDARLMTPQVALDLAKRLKPALGSIEGQNQPNLFTPELFPEGIRKHQNAVYDALKADPQTRDIPVLSPALDSSGDSAGALGTVSADLGAMQPLAMGELFDQSLEEATRATRRITPTQPLQISQIGYNTTGSTGATISERAQAKYLSRHVFEAWNRGVVRTYLYEFVETPLPDATDNFGIVRGNGTPKPAFYAIRNLIALFSDARPFVQPNPLRFLLSGETSNLRSSLLQKSDGRRYLVMWINAPSFNATTRSDTASFSQTVSLRFDKNQRVTIYRPTFSTQAMGKTRDTKTLSLDLDDELTVIELGS